MFEQFSIYPEIKYMATASAQGIGPGDKIQVTPDLENFKLERFKDLRKEHKKYRFKLILIGTSKTNIFIDGPDDMINSLITKLPSYIGKHWSEISIITIERSFINCRNFLIDDKCNPWIIDKFEFKEIKTGEEIPYLNNSDLLEADKICSGCDNFVLRYNN